MFYLIKYLTKNKAEITNTLSCMNVAHELAEKHPSRAPDAETDQRKAQLVLTKTLNQISGLQEYSLPMAVASLLQENVTECSHSFCYLFTQTYMKHVRSVLRKEKAESDTA